MSQLLRYLQRAALYGLLVGPLAALGLYALSTRWFYPQLLPSEWALKTFSDKNEDWIISEQPFPPPMAS